MKFAAVEIVVIQGPDAGSRLRIPSGGARIGTSPGCYLWLTDNTVSRLHCEIEVRPDGVRIVEPDQARTRAHIDGDVAAAVLEMVSIIR